MNSFVKGFLYFLVLTALLFALVSGVRFTRNYLISRAVTPPEGVEVKEITQTSAEISWETEKETQSTIIYGEDSKNLPLMTFESEAEKNHEITLSLLSSSTIYYFKIKVGDKEFDDQGLPWQFTTLSTVPAPTSSDFNPNRFQEKFGTSDPIYDLNHDGIVNTTDYSLYLQSQ